ncbi:MAG TPA: RHS repeat-associated core domain-containing protein, partial [Gemmataceae bacterium]|nr:RHS repeat-associated core domain-containing protein [Gemmataceae bacterium]
STGTSLGSVTYDGFGKVLTNTLGTNADAYMFEGAKRDSTTGLDYHDARWYNPATGSWISRDPGGFAMGDANLYRAMGNALTDGVDPSGYQEIDKVMVPDNNWTLVSYGINNSTLRGIEASGRAMTPAEVDTLVEILKYTPPADFPALQAAYNSYAALARAIIQKQLVLWHKASVLSQVGAYFGSHSILKSAIGKLGDKDYRVRERVSWVALNWAMLDPLYAYPLLAKALNSGDPEASWRAQVILNSIVKANPALDPYAYQLMSSALIVSQIPFPTIDRPK